MVKKLNCMKPRKYRDAYHGIYDVDQNGNEIWNDEVLDKIMQEVLADAYAGKDTFAQGVEEYTDMSREAASQIEERGGEVRGPPEGAFALREFSDGVRFVDVNTDQEQFDGLSIQEMNSLAKSIIKKKYAGTVVGIDNPLFVNGNSAEKHIYYTPKTTADVIEAKARASTELENLIDAGTNFESEPDGRDGHIHPDAVNGFSYFDTIFKVGSQYYKGKINIKNNGKGRLYYGVTKIENITEDIHASYGDNPMSIFLRDASSKSVPQEKKSVKSSESLSTSQTAQENGADPIEAMPTKAKKFMERAENKLQRSLSDVLNLPKMLDGVMDEVSREISKEFLETGTVSDETIDRTFEKVYSAIEEEVDEQYGVDAEDRRKWAERDYVAEIGKRCYCHKADRVIYFST